MEICLTAVAHQNESGGEKQQSTHSKGKDTGKHLDQEHLSVAACVSCFSTTGETKIIRKLVKA